MRPMSLMKTPLRAISVSVTLLLAGCGLFGADRPDPPPYPAETDASALVELPSLHQGLRQPAHRKQDLARVPGRKRQRDRA